MIKYTGNDPIHDRPDAATADELRDNLQTLHGSLLRLERTATNPQAAGAFHAAQVLVADVLWPGAAA